MSTKPVLPHDELTQDMLRKALYIWRQRVALIISANCVGEGAEAFLETWFNYEPRDSVAESDMENMNLTRSELADHYTASIADALGPQSVHVDYLIDLAGKLSGELACFLEHASQHIDTAFQASLLMAPQDFTKNLEIKKTPA